MIAGLSMDLPYTEEEEKRWEDVRRDVPSAFLQLGDEPEFTVEPISRGRFQVLTSEGHAVLFDGVGEYPTFHTTLNDGHKHTSDGEANIYGLEPDDLPHALAHYESIAADPAKAIRFEIGLGKFSRDCPWPGRPA